MLTGISTVNIPVKDYEKAIEFYTKNLGMNLVTNEPSIEHYEVATANPKRPTLCLCEDSESVGESTGIVFRTNDIQATYRAFRRNGVQVTEPYEAHGEWWSGFRDLDGNSYGIHQEAD